MAKITIDQYDLSIHQRYAADKKASEALDIRFDESSYISKQFEATQGTSLIQSKWEELFEVHIHRHPFASFGIPPQFIKLRKRFFSNALSLKFEWVDPDDEEENEEKQKKTVDEYKDKVLAKKSKMLPKALFEKDRTAVLNLLDSIQMLNTFLRELHARKLQYQKG